MIAIVPVHFYGKCGRRHWHGVDINLHVLGNGSTKASWDDRDHVGSSDDGREDMEGWHPKRVFPVELMVLQEPLNSGVRHAGRISNRVLS